MKDDFLDSLKKEIDASFNLRITIFEISLIQYFNLLPPTKKILDIDPELINKIRTVKKYLFNFGKDNIHKLPYKNEAKYIEYFGKLVYIYAEFFLIISCENKIRLKILDGISSGKIYSILTKAEKDKRFIDFQNWFNFFISLKPSLIAKIKKRNFIDIEPFEELLFKFGNYMDELECSKPNIWLGTVTEFGYMVAEKYNKEPNKWNNFEHALQIFCSEWIKKDGKPFSPKSVRECLRQKKWTVSKLVQVSSNKSKI